MSTHFNEPVDEKKPLHGTGRHGYDVPPEVQQKVIDIIIEEARKMGMNNRDTAYYMAIAKRESSFNPDAASEGSSASGIAQVIDDTAATYGITDANRFDARSSIKAGLGYFAYLKQRTIEDYGSASGKYEVLIYYRYHYGENSTRWLEEVKPPPKPKRVWRIKPFEELEKNKRYPDSKTVVDEADRIEAILNAAHGLVIQLTDVMGKPMTGRKAIAITKTPKPSGPPAPPKPVSTPVPAPAPAPAAAAPAPVPAPTQTPAPVAAPSPQPTAAPATAESTPPSADATQAPAPASMPAATDAAPATAAVTPPSPVDGDPDAPFTGEIEWELHAQEITTDADGKLPEITSDSQQAVMLLIPRVDVEAYNDAVSKEGMPEDGNEHVLKPHDGEDVAQSFPAPDNGWKPTPENTGGVGTATPTPAPAPAPPPAPKPTPKPAAPAPAAKQSKPAAPTNVFDAAAQSAKDKAAAKPAPTHEITFEDIVASVKKDIGWNMVYMTSFAYVKQFMTRPKLQAAPLATATPAAPAPARTQVVGSSLPAKDAKKPKVEEKVQTAAQPAVKPVAVTGDAAWMPIAIKEQGKDGASKVTEKAGDQRNDPKWKEQRKLRTDAKQAQDTAQKSLQKEKAKHTPDTARIESLQADIDKQKKAYADADAAMLKIEQDYNNPDIITYLHTTSLTGDMPRNDDTSWCSAFANWCMKQAGYTGSNDALAESWLKWGEELTEPRYGAVTVVTRAANPTKYHVGFYIGMGERNVPDGEEEVEVKAKDGTVTKKMKKKFKKVKAVRLLSGNYSNMIKEDTAWTVDAADSAERHLVSYRWPTAKDKQ